MDMAKARHTYIVSGKVHKARYRDYIHGLAEDLDLSGKVENRHRGFGRNSH